MASQGAIHFVRAVCAAVTKPVNFMAGIRGKSFTVAGTFTYLDQAITTPDFNKFMQG